MKLRSLLLFCFLLEASCYPQPRPHWVDLSWGPSTSKNVTSYNIYRRSQSGGPFIKIGSTAGTEFTDHQVKAGEKYLYTVTAVEGNVEGAYSKQVKAHIPRP